MIKTKEDLHLTFIDGSCEELKKLLEKVKEFGLEVNPSAFKNTAIGVDLTLVNRANFYQVDHNGDNLDYYKDVLGYEELSLADFEEEDISDNNNTENTKYRYEVVDMTPAEIYSAMLNGETFYVNEQEMYWNGNAFWCSCERVRFIEDDHEVCRKVEFTWQDEVIEKSRYLKLKGCCYSVYASPLADILGDSDVFLELARVALRATGELK